MKIEILNFTLEPQESGGFNLLEEKITDMTKSKAKNQTTTVVHGYSMSFKSCIHRIAHICACRNKKTVSLQQFLDGYEKLVNKLDDISREHNI